MFEVVATGSKSDIVAAWSELAWAEPSPTPAVDHQELRHNVWQLRGYCETRADADLARSMIRAICPALFPVIEELPPTNWVEKSLEGLPAVDAGGLVIVGAHTAKTIIGGKIPIQIEAGEAFGTGHHGTTLGCLLALQKTIKQKRPAIMLDVGTGTGVLSLAARKLGVSKIIASDMASEAITTAQENAKQNNCPNVHFIRCAGVNHKTIRHHGPYDLICTNIIAPVLKKLSPDLPDLLSPRGSLILSGILHHQVRSIKAHYGNRGLCLRKTTEIEGWFSLVYEKSAEYTA